MSTIVTRASKGLPLTWQEADNNFKNLNYGSYVSVKDSAYGAKGDGVTDDTAAIQAAINANPGRIIYLPTGSYRLTTTLNVVESITLTGENAATIIGGYSGSWLFFDHILKGISVTPSGSQIGPTFTNFGTRRNQPTVTGAWAPNDSDYDFWLDGVDARLENLMLLNPTRGIRVSRGRLIAKSVRGQPFKVGISVPVSYDVVRCHDIHWWPFWSDTDIANRYTRANRIAFELGRIDNPEFSNIFSIYDNIGMKFITVAEGSASHVLVSNFGFDGCGGTPIYFDSPNSSAEFSNGYTFGTWKVGEPKATYGLQVISAGNLIQISNVRMSYADKEIVSITGNTAVVLATGFQVELWDQIVGGYYALKMTGTNSQFLIDPSFFANGPPTTVVALGSKIRLPIIQETNSISLSPSVGSGFSAEQILRYTVNDRWVNFYLYISVTNNGTGSGILSGTLPYPAATNLPQVCVGRELVLTGSSITATIYGSNIQIYTYNNLYPAATGSVFAITGTYLIDT